jgi:hypothetical protein
MNWIVAAGAAFLAETAGLAACLHLFFLLKREYTELRTTLGAELEAQREATESLRAAVKRLEERLASELARPPAPAEPPREPSPGLSLNLSKRSVALRMHRRGEPPEAIAATLQVPRNEVELLMKVHRSFSEKTGVSQ